MALLTADDVLNKKFQPTKFREGYDQDEVDDFLDEVVNTLSSMASEKEELQAKLAAAERRVAELTSGAYAPSAPSAGTTPEPAPEPEVAPEPEPEPAAPAVSSPSPAEATAAPEPVQPETEGTQSATGMLALAQRLHDEYVSNGKDEGDRILREARSEAETLVRTAEDNHNRMVTQMEQERTLLERKIDELRVFERDYRTRLKSYLESLLSDVEGRGNVSGGQSLPEPGPLHG